MTSCIWYLTGLPDILAKFVVAIVHRIKEAKSYAEHAYMLKTVLNQDTNQ